MARINLFDSDRLGKIGESRFEDMCLHAGLFVNKVNWDRTGWDFIVESEFPEIDDSRLLGIRTNPPGATVQVKTVYEGATYIKLRMSSAERLCSNPQVTFICIIVFDKNNDNKSFYMLHVADRLMEFILKSVRMCIAQNVKRNKRHISLPFQQFGEALIASPANIASAINRACGNDPLDYATRKDADKRKMGFAERPYSIAITFPETDVDRVSRASLTGEEIVAERFVVEESRWGIKIPIHCDSDKPRVKIKSNGTCAQLCLRAGDDCVSLPVTLFAPVINGRDNSVNLIRLVGKGFSITLDLKGCRASFQCDIAWDQEALISNHLVLYRTANIFASGEFEIEIFQANKRVFQNVLQRDERSCEPSKAFVGGEALTGALAILSKAGATDALVSMRDVSEQSETISFLTGLIADEKNKLTLSINLARKQQPVEVVGSVNLLVLGCICFADKTVCFAVEGLASIRTNGRRPRLAAKNFRPRRLEALPIDQGLVENFCDHWRTTVNATAVINLGRAGIY